jgi:hypothetical protein
MNSDIKLLQYKKNKYKLKYLNEKRQQSTQLGGLCMTPNREEINGECVIPSNIPIESSMEIKTEHATFKGTSVHGVNGLCRQKHFFKLLDYKVKSYSKDISINLNKIAVYSTITLENISDVSKYPVFSLDTNPVISEGVFGIVLRYVHINPHNPSEHGYISVKYGKRKDAIDQDIYIIDYLKDKDVTELYVPSLYIKESDPFPSVVIMEYIDGILSDIPFEVLSENSYITLFNILLQIAKTLNAFKKYNLWYLDYKPANIFYRCNTDDKSIQVIFGDLGSLCEFGKSCTITYPPLSLLISLSVSDYGKEPFIDQYLVWGVAVMMYTLIGYKFSLDPHFYSWQYADKYRKGQAYNSQHQANIQTLKNSIKVDFGTKEMNDSINFVINTLITHIFITYDASGGMFKTATGTEIPVITLQKTIDILQAIILIIK